MQTAPIIGGQWRSKREREGREERKREEREEKRWTGERENIFIGEGFIPILKKKIILKPSVKYVLPLWVRWQWNSIVSSQEFMNQHIGFKASTYLFIPARENKSHESLFPLFAGELNLNGAPITRVSRSTAPSYLPGRKKNLLLKIHLVKLWWQIRAATDRLVACSVAAGI